MPAELTPVELKTLWDRGESPLVVDVREDWELGIAKLPQAVHMPMNEVPQRLAELPRDARIVVMCRSGGRSMQVARFLERNGFGQVANLTGGILAWRDAIDPSLAAY